MPRARLGALPFPGPFTLYTTADPESLGMHSYSGHTLRGADPEVDRGILYTKRAGFIDLCHVRNAADMTAYIRARTRLAISRGWLSMRFKAHEPSEYTVAFTYPDGWDRLGADERDRIIDELSVRVAQRLAFDVMTWHEILTWYGYKSTIVIPEQGSAFTYEDTTSHMLGIMLAAQAIRAGGDYDQQMTRALDDALGELDVVGEEGLEEAVGAVKGDWWSTLGGPLKRDLDIGTADGAIEPWIVPSVSDDNPVTFRLAQLDSIHGHDLSDFYILEIDPKVLEGYKIRSRLEGDPSRIIPKIHFPVLMADIAEHLGDEARKPQDLPIIAKDN